MSNYTALRVHVASIVLASLGSILIYEGATMLGSLFGCAAFTIYYTWLWLARRYASKNKLQEDRP